MTNNKVLIIMMLFILTSCASQNKQQVYDDQGGYYRLSAAGSLWAISFQKGGFKLAQRKQRDNKASTYYLFSDNTTGVDISFYFEPVEKCQSSEACREFQLKRPSESMLVATRTENYMYNNFAVTEYFLREAGPELVKMVPELKGQIINQNNFNAHLVDKGYWVDIHASQFQSSEADRMALRTLLNTITIESN